MNNKPKNTKIMIVTCLTCKKSGPEYICFRVTRERGRTILDAECDCGSTERCFDWPDPKVKEMTDSGTQFDFAGMKKFSKMDPEI